MTVELSYEDAKRDLIELAAANPDYVYKEVSDRGCVYFYNDKPSCIVGHVLAKHGVSREDLRTDIESDDGSRRVDLNYESDVRDLIAWNFLEVDEDTKILLQTAQDQQDRSTSWSRAVEVAINVVDDERAENGT